MPANRLIYCNYLWDDCDFNPILDSARIYFVFLRFTISSILTFILDTIVFFIAFHLGAGIIFSTIMARIAGGSFSFTVNKYVVFKSKKKQILGEALKFTLLVVLLGTIAIFLISAIQRLGFGIFFSKMFAEGLLFVMSFTVQRIFVFSRNVRLHVQSQSEIEKAE